MASAQNPSFANSEELTVYPPRSLGEAFRRYRRTDEWSRKAPTTRDDWWRGWKRIKPIFGDVDPRTVRLDDISTWRAMIEDKVSLREAHRSLKIWRALWKVTAALGYCVRDADPSLGVRNSAAKGRTEKWLEGEVARLAKRAWRMKYYGLAAVICVAWDTRCLRVTCGPCGPRRWPQPAQGSCSLPSEESRRPVCGQAFSTPALFAS
jgi:hypothetical protein